MNSAIFLTNAMQIVRPACRLFIFCVYIFEILTRYRRAACTGLTSACTASVHCINLIHSIIFSTLSSFLSMGSLFLSTCVRRLDIWICAWLYFTRGNIPSHYYFCFARGAVRQQGTELCLCPQLQLRRGER